VTCVVCRVSCVVCRVSCVVCRVSCVVCRVFCTLKISLMIEMMARQALGGRHIAMFISRLAKPAIRLTDTLRVVV
jgi:hypothetical protein